MRPRWAVLTPPPCLLSLPSAFPIAWLPPANTPGLEGLPGRRGNSARARRLAEAEGAGRPRFRGRDCPGAAGLEAQGSSGHAGGWRGAGGTGGRQKIGVYPASQPISRCF